jgi:esterase/lipase superfamily enzyme
MHIEYHKWWSPNLDQEMELKVYGECGKPVVVFPSQCGKFYQFEDFGMVGSVSSSIADGKIILYTVDSIDHQSWTNLDIHPGDRAIRHNQYDRYIVEEVVPFLRDHKNYENKFVSTGCSMGGYHAANFFFRHPDIFDVVISLSGIFQLRMFVGDYLDDNVYFNSPLHYLPGLDDPSYLDQYRASQIVICSGQGAWEDEMISDALALKRILESKNVPCWIDLWGYDVNHDWPWWRKQLPYFLNQLGY